MSNIYDKSSLVLIPSGTKTGKVFSQKPVSGDGDFTFTRASAATRVNADGNIEKETQNLLLQSNSFDTTWVKNAGATLVSGQSGYDGSNDAWRINVTTTSNSGLYQYSSPTSLGVNTISLYAKAGDINYIGFTDFAGTNWYIWFDLSNGTIASQSGYIDSSITDVGGGWYRLSMTSTNFVIFQIKPSSVATNPSSSAGYIFIQDAQAEQGLVARDYIETTTAAVYGGITDNTPRLDYTDSSCPALLLEPLRTNNVPNSEYHQGTIAAVTRTYNTPDTLSPEGVYNAVKYEVNANNSDPYLRVFNIPTSGNSATFSLYVKGASGQLFSMILGRDGYNELEYEAFTLDGTWQRLDISKTFTTTPTTLTIGAEFSHSSDDGVLGQEYYLYGLQVEAASYATSYIPTYGSSVTRIKDSCINTSATSVIGQTEGTMYAEFDWEQKSGVYFVSDLSTGSTSNEILIAIGNAADNRVRFQIQNSGVDQVNFNSGVISSGTHKVALAYKENDVVAYLDGVLINSDTSGSIPVTSQYRLERANGTLGYAGGIKQSMLFKTRLSNEELADLTTL